MGLPQALGDLNNLHYYQGIIIAEVAVTLFVYLFFKVVHYLKWGAAQQEQVKKPPIAENNSQPPNQEDTFIKRWQQDTWDIFFPIIYTTHMASLALCLLYIPYIFQTIIAYIHLALFLALCLVNVFVKDIELGNGNRTTVSRILWARNLFLMRVMCICNFMLMVAGLTGISMVY